MDYFHISGKQVFQIPAEFPQLFVQRNNLIYLYQFLPNFVAEE